MTCARDAAVAVALSAALVAYFLPQFSGAAVLTDEQLRLHGPAAPDPWVALLGHVFDVSSAANMYGTGGGYSFFAGKDATRAFVTGARAAPRSPPRCGRGAHNRRVVAQGTFQRPGSCRTWTG